MTISDGNNHFFRNFGNYKIPVYNITGYKWNDLNGNGIRDPGEPGLANWTIGLGNATIPYYATNITDAAGNYSFVNVPKGIFVLNETLQPGWKNTTPLTQTACTPPFPYLPPPGVPGTSVEVFYQSGGTPVPVGDFAYFRTEISGVNPTPGYDIENKLYPGWCADSANPINPSVLYGTCCFHDTSPPFQPGLSAKYPAILTAQWDKVNYVLNKRPYYYTLWGAQNTSNVVQAVIWNLTNGVPLTAQQAV